MDMKEVDHEIVNIAGAPSSRCLIRMKIHC